MPLTHTLSHSLLSWPHVQALAKYAFGLGTLQMVLCTAIFTGVGLPLFNLGPGPGSESLVTEFLEDVAKVRGGGQSVAQPLGCWSLEV